MQNPSESVNFQQGEGFPVQNAQKKVPNKKAAVPAALNRSILCGQHKKEACKW